jgi:ankyrin repeat protein
MRHLGFCVALLLLACGGEAPREITPLAAAARDGDVTAIAAMARAGYDPNALDPGLNHWTPLLHAIHKGQPAAVTALLAAGADVNRGAPGGNRPLRMAVGNGRADIVSLLLEAGADPHVDGPDLLATALSGGALTDIDQPLLGRCNTDVVRALLTRAPDLRLRTGFRTRIAVLFAKWNHCSDALQMVRIG